jgi:hypothetical protein
MGWSHWRMFHELGRPAPPAVPRPPAAPQPLPTVPGSPAAVPPAAWAEAVAAWAAARDPFAPSLIAFDATANHRDQRGSRRTMLAAAMLRRGDDIDQIAQVTGVPRALIELIRDELDKGETERGELHDRVDPRLGKRLRRRWRRSPQARQLITMTVIVEFAASANIVASITALIQHSVNLGVLTGVVALALILAVWTLVRAVTPTKPTPPRPPPPAPGARD